MASVCFTVENATLDEALTRLAPVIREHGFRGGVMLSVIPVQDGVWQMDVTHTDASPEGFDDPTANPKPSKR